MAKPFILTPRIEEILRTVHFYRYMTALDVACRLFSPASLTHARELLKILCGGDDCVHNQYLFRFALAQASGGKAEKVFTLGSRGKDYLQSECAFASDWYFRPQNIKHLSHAFIEHNLTLTRFLVAAHLWCRKDPGVALLEARISYEMEKSPGKVVVVRGGRQTEVKVIPDAWMLFKDLKEDMRMPVLLEIDRGREYKEKFKEHVRARLEFVRSGAYQKLFEGKGCVIAYATTGELPEYRQSRIRAMRSWTWQVLSEMNLKSWAPILRFTGIVRKNMYEEGLFEKASWQRPDVDAPLGLLSG